MRREVLAERLEIALRKALAAPSLRLIELAGERPVIDEQREPWIPIKYGAASVDDWCGVVPAVARIQRAPGSQAERMRLAVKVNPRDGLARTLIPWIVEHRSIALDRPYWEYRCAAGFDHTGAREQHVYALSDRISALGDVLPRCFGHVTDEASGEHALFLEFLTHVDRLDATGAAADWPGNAIDDALRAAGAWHAAFWNVAPATVAWAGPRPETADMLADVPLWRGLLDDARARFPAIVTEAVWHRRHKLIDTIADWHPIKDRLPATLAHNDFNQRNVGFRPGVVVLDWEIVERNIAQRDLVEMLTFLVPPNAGRAEIDRHVNVHRTAIVEAGVSGLDRDAWFEGFRCELQAEAINRVAHQLLFAAQFPLAYLERINANIEHLLDLYA